jgi:hypothetical protein
MLGMFRIAIELTDELTSWKEYKHVGKIPSDWYKAYEETAKRSGGNPRGDWYCSFEDVPAKRWVKIELYVENHWVDISDCVEEAIELFQKIS